MSMKVQVNRSMMEAVTVKVLDVLNRDGQLTRKQYLKVKLGLEVLLINLSKLAVIVAAAVLAGVLTQMAIFALAFFSIRMFAYGAHATSSFKCTWISCVTMVGIPLLLVHGGALPVWALAAVGAINMLVLYRYAPSTTVKNPIGSSEKKRRQRRRALTANGVLILAALCMPSALVGSLIMTGALAAGSLVLPYIHKIFT